MFTGIIEELGTVVTAGTRLSVGCSTVIADASVGDSIAVNGVCLTAAELDPYLVYKGSIAIDGISLTVASIQSGVLSVTIIPHTFRNTTLAGYRPGARVNLETDILAKHVEKLLQRLDLKQPLTVDKLREQGY